MYVHAQHIIFLDISMLPKRIWNWNSLKLNSIYLLVTSLVNNTIIITQRSADIVLRPPPVLPKHLSVSHLILLVYFCILLVYFCIFCILWLPNNHIQKIIM